MESGVPGGVDVAKMDYSGGASSAGGPPGGGGLDRPPPPMDREPRPYPSYNREPSRGLSFSPRLVEKHKLLHVHTL